MSPDVAAIPLFFLVALLYSSVGHAGASGYLAVLTLFIGLNEPTAKPTALILNLLVGTIGTLQFAAARQIDWRALAPYCLGSVPLAFYGGLQELHESTYKICVGLVLLAASARLLLGIPTRDLLRPASDWLAIPVGAAIGLLSGLTGTGGGIFLTPLLLLAGWAAPKQAAGMSVAFILANSTAGLAGRLRRGPLDLPEQAVIWAIAAVIGGLLGSWYGARRSTPIILRRLLALVLLIAAGKLLFTA